MTKKKATKKEAPCQPAPSVHVDNYIWSAQNNPYATWVLHYFRLPAIQQLNWHPFMKEHKLFCTWKGGRYRVTGASRFGDVWLTKLFDRDDGYDERVNVDQCSAWGPKP